MGYDGAPPDFAASEGHTHVVQMLITTEADVNAGFVRDGKKYIICSMIVFDESFPLKPRDNKFRRFFDIGCNVVRIAFDCDANVVLNAGICSGGGGAIKSP